MPYRLTWKHGQGYAECNEGWVEQQQKERDWDAFMNFIDAQGNPDSRELGTFMTKREAMDRVEQEFEQAPGPPCKVLMKDGHKVVETSIARAELPAAVQAGHETASFKAVGALSHRGPRP